MWSTLHPPSLWELGQLWFDCMPVKKPEWQIQSRAERLRLRNTNTSLENWSKVVRSQAYWFHRFIEVQKGTLWSSRLYSTAQVISQSNFCIKPIPYGWASASLLEGDIWFWFHWSCSQSKMMLNVSQCGRISPIVSEVHIRTLLNDLMIAISLQWIYLPPWALLYSPLLPSIACLHC